MGFFMVSFKIFIQASLYYLYSDTRRTDEFLEICPEMFEQVETSLI